MGGEQAFESPYYVPCFRIRLFTYIFCFQGQVANTIPKYSYFQKAFQFIICFHIDFFSFLHTPTHKIGTDI